jgi:spermidine/putrescine transport system permease protein
MSEATPSLNTTVTETGAAATEAAERRALRTRWLLNAPALIIIGGIGVMPLTIILLYSLLEPAEYAGVIWKFSTEPGST